jgi:aspartate aminotransferase
VSVSATLAADETARRLRAQGVDVLPLGFGQAGVPVHPLLRQAIADAAGRNGYGSVAGSDELREAAAGYWRRRGLPTDAGQVLAGPGSKALLYTAVQAIGGDVVLPQPSWVSYAAQVTLLGGRPIYVPTAPGEGGVPAPDLLAAAVRRARSGGREVGAVVLTVPDNPTGTMASAGTIERLCMVARDLGLVIISDEIYRDLVYGDTFVSPAEFAPERVLVTSGLSKSMALGGWRLGVARLPAGEVGSRLSGHMLAAASEIWSSVAQPVQYAAAQALTEPAELVAYVASARRLYQAINTAVAEVFTAAGARVSPPQAAFYLYPDLEPVRDRLAGVHGVRTGPELADFLLSRYGVAVLPGSAFGERLESLTLRVAAGMLTGGDDDQRLTALTSAEPLRLPWIAGPLDRLAAVLSDLVPLPA